MSGATSVAKNAPPGKNTIRYSFIGKEIQIVKSMRILENGRTS